MEFFLHESARKKVQYYSKTIDFYILPTDAFILILRKRIDTNKIYVYYRNKETVKRKIITSAIYERLNKIRVTFDNRFAQSIKRSKESIHNIS